jgi:RNA ligase (TIGR02306 family)
MTTGQAFIGKIKEFTTIEKADNLITATAVIGEHGIWRGVVKKGEFEVRGRCVVILQDSILPDKPEYEFMRRMNFRVKMCRFRGAPSECLILPCELAGDIGDDVSEILGVTKYEKPVHVSLGGQVRGNFPTHLIPKTDEPNFQSVPGMIEILKEKAYYATIKVDGSSATFLRCQERFHVCSRNLDLAEGEGNVLWSLAKKYKLEEKIPIGFGIQAEVFGPKIQGNPLGSASADLRVFNLYSITEHKYLGLEALHDFCLQHDLPMVPISRQGILPSEITSDILQLWADIKYPNGSAAEGIVVRPIEEMTTPQGNRLSFKVINLNYKER